MSFGNMILDINRGSLGFERPEDEPKLRAIQAALADRAIKGFGNGTEDLSLRDELQEIDESGEVTFLSAELVEEALHLLPVDHAITRYEMATMLGQLYARTAVTEHMHAAAQARHSAEEAGARQAVHL